MKNNNKNICNFIKKSQIFWSEVIAEDSFQRACTIFHPKFYNLFNVCFHEKIKCEWLSKAILNSIGPKNKLFYKSNKYY